MEVNYISIINLLYVGGTPTTAGKNNNDENSHALRGELIWTHYHLTIKQKGYWRGQIERKLYIDIDISF